MRGRARILAVMGSGETAPTMTKVHRALFERLGARPVPAVMLDTPFGFQANADELTSRALTYFRQSVDREVSVASFRRAGPADALALEQLRLQMHEASMVFAGPGSPSYALRQWVGSPVPAELAEKLRPDGTGGCVTFSSAAALTLGVVTVPVYEIYKAGEDPHWLAGLDLTAVTGLSLAVVPHYDNTEGGTHDTRYCYLGETRLRLLEAQLDAETVVLGIDEHTAAVLDLEAATLSVMGRGVVTVRAAGRSRAFEAGTTVPIEVIGEIGAQLRRSHDGRVATAVVTDGVGVQPRQEQPGCAAGAPCAVEADAPAGVVGAQRSQQSPLLEAIGALDAEFDAALSSRDATAAVRCVLAVESELDAWRADTLQSDEMERGRGVLRRMVVALGDAAGRGLTDPRRAVAPWVDALVAVRSSARSAKRWGDADDVRGRLLALGVEVRDGPAGSTWELTDPTVTDRPAAPGSSPTPP